VPGGGGGGGDALQEFDLSVTGFGGGITASEVTGSQRAFNQAMVADWHTLLTVEIPQQIPGGIMHFDLDSSVPVLNNGLLLDASTGFYGNELHLQGYITVGFTTVLSGRVYFDDAFGHRSNEATWTVTLTGV
jgi:hypothetical protein